MECWKKKEHGIMEYWNDGTMGKFKKKMEEMVVLLG